MKNGKKALQDHTVLEATLLSVGTIISEVGLESVHGGEMNMNQYVTGAVIKELREKNKLTQLQLADKLGVSDKTVSKWETGKGHR